MMRIILILLTFLVTSAGQAQVYRSVDKNGRIIFSDTPTEGAEEVEIKELETIRTLEPPPLPGPPSAPAPPEVSYTSIEITDPKNDSSLRDNTGNISVSVTLVPALRPSDKLVLYVDGMEHTSGQSTSFQLENIDRGTHQLRVVVVDANGRQQISSKAVTVHLLRHSVLQTKPAGNPPPKQTAR